MATIFSKIIAGEIPCYKVAENDEFFAFLDINPLNEGHTLVVPKQEIDYFFDLNPELLGRLMQFTQQIAINIKNNIKCKRVAVTVLGLDVPHAHVHLIPMNDMSDVDFRKDKLKLTNEEFMRIKNLIEIK